jgi:hypothetical protein
MGVVRMKPECLSWSKRGVGGVQNFTVKSSWHKKSFLKLENIEFAHTSIILLRSKKRRKKQA